MGYRRLGDLEYKLSRDDQNTELNAARDLFLSYVKKLAPEVLEDLAAIKAEMAELNIFRCGQSIAHVWAAKYNLSDPWLLNRAINTLIMWHVHPALKDKWCRGYVNLGLVPGMIIFTFEAQDWDPAQMNWHDYERYLDNKFRSLKTEHREKTERLAQERGLQKVPYLRTEEKFGWLAMYQVLKKSGADIAEEAGCDKSNVSQRITEAAGLIGLTLRKPLPGIKKRHKQRKRIDLKKIF